MLEPVLDSRDLSILAFSEFIFCRILKCTTCVTLAFSRPRLSDMWHLPNRQRPKWNFVYQYKILTERRTPDFRDFHSEKQNFGLLPDRQFWARGAWQFSVVKACRMSARVNTCFAGKVCWLGPLEMFTAVSKGHKQPPWRKKKGPKSNSEGWILQSLSTWFL